MENTAQSQPNSWPVPPSFCYQCGKPVDATGSFCGNCAAPVQQPAGAAAPGGAYTIGPPQPKPPEPAPVAAKPVNWRKYIGPAGVAGALLWKFKFVILYAFLRTRH